MSGTLHAGASGHGAMGDLEWSRAEKNVARKAFDSALNRELEAVMIEVKKRAEKIKQPSDVWELERYLTERRGQIDRQFDYRYSVLVEVFGNLIHGGSLSDQELQGLGEDKLTLIRRYAAFLSS
jgi:photoprotection regulator FRP-like protein